MIIFSSDNGAEKTYVQRIKMYDHFSNKDLRGGKRQVYEGGHRVPFFVYWPNGIKGGRTCDSPVNQIDLFATLADIVGDKMLTNEAEDSVSFADFFKESELAKRLPMIHHSIDGAFAIREDKWKLVFGSKANDKKVTMALYNLEDDLSESKNLIDEYPEIVENLQKQAATIIDGGKTRPECITENDSDVKYWWK